MYALFTATLLAISAPSFAQAAREGVAAPRKAAAAVVNINTAGVAELETLPGVGSRTAALIVEYRQKNGPFKKIEELMNVRGRGEKTFLKLRPQLTIAGTARAAASETRH
ncbi:MAG: helix-hairpin-helix domain-containing protein [Acidobacteria bacterium]|nr:helix-hairpin-helix domain-containing protein [Acidobacteriota bacterium]